MASRMSTSRKSREDAAHRRESSQQGAPRGLRGAQGGDTDRLVLVAWNVVATGHMDVCIDQSRHDRSTSEIDRAAINWWSRLPAPDIDDSVSIDQHPPIDSRIREPVEYE